jgi:hypothetical protein
VLARGVERPRSEAALVEERRLLSRRQLAAD